MDIVVMFFLFGLIAGLLRSELKLPASLYESLSVFLLLAIGLKGGQGLAQQDLLPFITPAGCSDCAWCITDFNRIFYFNNIWQI